MTIEDEYVIEQILFDDGVYTWMQANDAGNLCFLQMPSIELTSIEAQRLIAAFKELDDRTYTALLTPQKKLSSAKYPFIGVYPSLPADFLAVSSASLDPATQAGFWDEACKALRQLHNAEHVHGAIDERSFRIKASSIFLGGFGCASLIASSNAAALAAAQEFLAPEIRRGGHPMTASDIYAFGKLVLQVFPHLRETAWEDQVCTADPAKRPKINEVRDILRPLLLSAEREPIGPTGGGLEPVGPTITKSFVIVAVEPLRSGTVTGGGWLVDGTTATFQAESSTGFHFSHWSGGVSGKDNPIQKLIIQNLAVTAHFVPKSQPSPPFPLPSFVVTVLVEPAGAGTVTGAGSYDRNGNATLEATPAAGNKFSHWSGDLVGSDNPTRQSITKNVAATAHFRPDDPVFTVNISQNLPFGGSVTGAGSYKTGMTVVLTANPNTGFLFTGWSGDVKGSKTMQSVIVTKNITARANFKARPRITVTPFLVIAALVIAFLVWPHQKPLTTNTQTPERGAKPSVPVEKKVIVKTPSPPKPTLVRKFDAVQSAKDAEQSNQLVNKAQADLARLDPQHPSIVSLAMVAQNCKKAVSYSQKAISEDPSDRDAWEHAYDAYYLLGKDYYKDCEALRERAVKRFPNYDYFSTNGIVYIKMKEHIRQQQKRINKQRAA